MKAELDKRSFLTTYRLDLPERIASFTQGSMTVAECSDEFNTLRSIAEVISLSTLLLAVTRESSAKPNILRLYNINTIGDAFQTTIQTESILATHSALP